MSAKNENLSQFFQSDGRTVIVPIDHGTAIPVPGLERPADLIAALSPFADGFVVNAGLARACRDELAGKGVCLRTDVYKPAPDGSPGFGSFLTFDIEDADALGASAVMNMCYPHHPNEAEIIRECAHLIRQSADSGIPVILESLPFGIGLPEKYTPENISFAVRLAAELGADVVKTAYPGDKAAFRDIVDACFVPVIVLGGAAADTPAEVIRMAADAVAAGASGVAIGRNVWQHPNPPKMAEALHAVVHQGASAKDAVKQLES